MTAHPMNKGSDAELLPCPFCGEQPWSGEMRDHWAIQCINRDCTVKPALARTDWETLVRHWNTRALTKVEDTE